MVREGEQAAGEVIRGDEEADSLVEVKGREEGERGGDGMMTVQDMQEVAGDELRHLLDLRRRAEVIGDITEEVSITASVVHLYLQMASVRLQEQQMELLAGIRDAIVMK